MRARIRSVKVYGRVHVVEDTPYGKYTREWHEEPIQSARLRGSGYIESRNAKKIQALRELFSHLQPSMERKEIVLVV